jgi:hypothetical protein
MLQEISFPKAMKPAAKRGWVELLQERHPRVSAAGVRSGAAEPIDDAVRGAWERQHGSFDEAAGARGGEAAVRPHATASAAEA